MERIVACVFFAWIAVMGIGVIIALLPLILYAVGFLLMLGLLALVGRLIGSWFYF